MSLNVEKFIKNLFWSFIGVSIMTAVMFCVHIFGGRFIGPEEYGKYSLIYSISTFLVLPAILGFPAAIQMYTSKNMEQKKKIISTGYSLVVVLGILWIGIYLIFKDLIISVLKIDSNIFLASIIFIGIMGAHQMTGATMQGLLQIKRNTIFQIIAYISLFATFIYLLFFQKKLVFSSIYLPIILAYSLLSLLVLINIRKCFFKFSWKWAKILFHLSFYAILARVLFVLITNLDKIMINYFMSLSSVGIYQAYITSSQSINLFLTPFIAVYFPTVSKIKDKINIFKKINKIAFPAFICVFVFLFTTMIVILKIYGKQYTLSWGLITLFSIAGGIFVVNSFYSFLIASKDVKNTKSIAGYLFFVMMLNFILNIVLIPRIGLYGAISATIAAYGLLLIFLLVKSKTKSTYQ